MAGTRSIDQEPHLPIALGAAIEVQTHVRAELGARSEAVLVLKRELENYKGTSLARDAAYGALADQPVPLSEVNHVRCGVSTTPTLVLVDRAGFRMPKRLTRPSQT